MKEFKSSSPVPDLLRSKAIKDGGSGMVADYRRAAVVGGLLGRVPILDTGCEALILIPTQLEDQAQDNGSVPRSRHLRLIRGSLKSDAVPVRRICGQTTLQKGRAPCDT